MKKFKGWFKLRVLWCLSRHVNRHKQQSNEWKYETENSYFPHSVGYPRGCSENFPHTNGSYQIKMSESVDHFQVSCQYTDDKGTHLPFFLLSITAYKT